MHNIISVINLLSDLFSSIFPDFKMLQVLPESIQSVKLETNYLNKQGVLFICNDESNESGGRVKILTILI